MSEPTSGGTVVGPDGLARCPWGLSAPEYVSYHDEEWGCPLRGDDAVLERLTLEAFQSGLSWLTILRKRPAFRQAFAGFSAEAVASFGAADVERLMVDGGIVRNRAKIEAAITNARAAVALPEGLSALVWSHAPMDARPPPLTLADVPTTTEASTTLAKELRRRGFVFVGPTTMYALMQALGLVNDHLDGCHARAGGVELFGASGGDPIELVAYDPRWPAAYEELRARIETALHPRARARVRHVGSTSVPGLAAKPVLDVQVAVADLADEEAYVPALERLGYVLRAREPQHRYLRPPAGAARTAHVHVCEHGSDWERAHALFAAYLHADTATRDAYEALKRDLAERHRDQRLAYTEGKKAFVTQALARAERWATRTGWTV